MADYKLPNPGRYQATLSRCTIGESGTKKTPYLMFTFDYTNDDGESGVGNCFWYITEDTIDRLWQNLEAIGYPHGTFDQIESDHPECFDFAGIQLDAVCKHEESPDGKNQAKWSLYPKKKAGPVAPELMSKLSKFNKKGGSSGASRPSPAKPANTHLTSGTTPPPPVSDDDAPF